MSIKTTTHINFRGEAREALSFYQSVFGGELAIVTYADAHAVREPSEAQQVMWGQVAGDNGFHVMAYDVPSALDWNPGTIPYFISVRSDDAEEIRGYWEKLIAGGTVVHDLAPAGWAPLYGMVKDRFGVTWVLDVTAR